MAYDTTMLSDWLYTKLILHDATRSATNSCVCVDQCDQWDMTLSSRETSSLGQQMTSPRTALRPFCPASEISITFGQDLLSQHLGWGWNYMIHYTANIAVFIATSCRPAFIKGNCLSVISDQKLLCWSSTFGPPSGHHPGPPISFPSHRF